MSETNGNVGQIYQLIPKVMLAVGAVEKSRKNIQQNYQFRGIDDFYAALHRPLCEHGMFVVPEVLAETREERQGRSGGTLIYTTLRVKHTFYAPDGSSIAAVTVGEAMDSGDKSANKAMSAAMKYALIEVFCIPTEEDNDTENASPEPAAKSGHKLDAAAMEKSLMERGTTDPMTDADKFEAILHEAFDAAGFEMADRPAVIASVCKTAKITRVTDLPPDRRNALVKAIVDGKFNKLKKHSPAAA
jgi:hypothetical protein